jgi:glycosyltransferase involved in cell wall biosynthesis
MRVALVANHLSRGGAERQAALWAEACLRLGHEPVVVAFEPLGGDYEIRGPVEVRYLDKAGPRDLPRLVGRLHRVTRGCDVVVAFQSFPALCCALAGLGSRTIVVAGNDPRHWGETSNVPPPLYRWAFRRAALACAPTKGIAGCHERLGVTPRRGWRIVPNIVHEAAFVPPPAEKRGALFVGRLAPVKDPELALRAAHLAAAPLTMVGTGELRERLERMQAERGNGVGTDIRGWLPSPWHAYAEHRVLLVTSHYESFGNVIVESLAAGTPVVSVDCDFGPREIVRGARFSHLTDRDAHELGERLRDVLDRPYSDAEREECLAIAGRFRAEAVTPLIGATLAEAT